jgi:hypothetical protein
MQFASIDTTKRAVALCLIVAAASSLQPLQELATSLGDTDDAMRLVQARALLHGRPWWDLIEPRLAPPAGLAVHWSRLVDAPIAAMLGVFGALFGTATGETITRALWPLLLFAPAAWAWVTTARRLGGDIAMWAAACLAPLCFMLFNQFAPGRLDHHNVQLLLMAGMMLAALDLDRPRNAAVLGGASALSLAVGFESLPVVIWAGGLIAARYVLANDTRGARAFGLSLGGVAVAAFVVQTPPSWWLRSGCDALQFNGMAGAAAVGLGLAAIAHLSLHHWAQRLSALAAIGMVGGAAFFGLHPSCLRGPYADLDPRIGTVWLNRVGEARALPRLFAQEPVLAIASALLPLGALAASAWAIVKGRRDAGFIALTVLLALTATVGLIQARGLVLATAAAIPLGAAALATLPRLNLVRPITAGMALGLLASPSVTLGALQFAVPAEVQAKEKQASHDQTPCWSFSAFSAMQRLPAGLVMADLDSGPFILANTHHSAASAPYHRLGGPIYDAMTMFYQPPGQAQAAVARSGADYLALCRTGVFAEEAKPGALAHALVHQAPPAWLTPLPAKDGSYLLYRVNKGQFANLAPVRD